MAENEIALLKQFVKDGDAEAFSEIVRRHAGMVYGVSLRMLEDESRAADVVQDTFLRLLHDADRITESLAGWLHRAATHKALDAVRGDRRRRKREAVYAAGKLRETEDWEQISGYVDEAMVELEEEARELLVKHFLEGRTMTDIAADGEISQATVSRRIESGVSELRKKLHSRGVLVAVGALGPWLVQNAAEAAPAIVVQELGKMALAGAAAVGSGAAAVGVSGGAGAATVGILVGVKAKVVTVAAVAVLGVGGIVTYQQASNRTEQGVSGEQVSGSIEQGVSQETPAAVTSGAGEQGQMSRTAVAVEEGISRTDTDDLERNDVTEDVRIAIPEPDMDFEDDVEPENTHVHGGGPVYVAMSYARPPREPNSENEGSIPDANGPPGGN